MSNQSLILRIEYALADIRHGRISARAFADTVENNGTALEAMPYALVQEMRSLTAKLHIAEWYDEDGFSPELEPLLTQTQAWLSKLPRL